jgi:carboxylesterase type B
LPSWAGSIHGDDIEFIFGKPLKNGIRYQQEEVAFAQDLVELWTSFAKTG